MLVMESGDLFTEVSIFLKVTLAEEKLTDHAEGCRQKLIARLAKRDVSPPPPQAYIDMNGGSYCHPKVQHQISDYCYEEFDKFLGSNSNNVYNNLSSMEEENIYANNDNETDNYINIKHPIQQEDNAYINPSSHLANTPVKPTLPAKNPSNPNSERNSVISFKKDSPDRTSDSSSFSSGSTRYEDSPEVLTTSASALRYAATKCGNLGRREKFLFMDHTKFYWGALLNQTLYMFSTDKDSKPSFELDITGYKARHVAISSNIKTDYKFELVSPGHKTHQFSVEKQSEMDSWILALNAAIRSVDPGKEWGRQLPTLPQSQNMYDRPETRQVASQDTYDQLDSGKRPLVEARYELPSTLPRGISQSRVHLALNQELAQFLSNQTKEKKPTNQLVPPDKLNGEGEKRGSTGRLSASPRETRRLPLLPHEQLETYDQPEPSIRPVNDVPELYESLREEVYHCIDDNQPQKSKEARRLPLLPHEQEMYDQPEPTIRPVNKPEIVQEEFYSVIDNADIKPVTQEAVYKNLEDDATNQSEEESNYYNLVPYPEKETDQECIYDVITEQRQLPNSKMQKPASVTPLPVSIDKRKTKLEERKISPLVNNMASIFSKPLVKPQLREVKPPMINKSYQ